MLMCCFKLLQSGFTRRFVFVAILPDLIDFCFLLFSVVFRGYNGRGVDEHSFAHGNKK